MTQAWTDYGASLEQYPAMAQEHGDHTSSGISTRMQALRLAFGPELGRTTQSAFAEYLGLKVTTWNNYERQGVRPDIDSARKIRARFGVTHDWIYEGDPRGLRLELVERLAPYLKGTRRAG